MSDANAIFRRVVKRMVEDKISFSDGVSQSERGALIVGHGIIMAGCIIAEAIRNDEQVDMKFIGPQEREDGRKPAGKIE